MYRKTKSISIMVNNGTALLSGHLPPNPDDVIGNNPFRLYIDAHLKFQLFFMLLSKIVKPFA